MACRPTAYSDGDLPVLRGLEPIRRRPGMYIGGTDAGGLHFLLGELLAHALAAEGRGPARRIDVALLADGGCRVADDGPGIPLGTAAERQAAERLFSEPGGVHWWSGFGLTATSALSRWLLVEVRRDGRLWELGCRRGQLTAPARSTGASRTTGTTITFWPDPDIFGAASISPDWARQRLRELAFLVPGLTTSLGDEMFHAPGGLVNFVGWINGHDALVHPTVLHGRESSGDAAVEVALRWADSRREDVRCFANAGPPHAEGTHVRGLRAAVTRFFRACCPGRREVPDGAAYRAGLTAVVAVNHPEPRWVGAIHGRFLGNPELEGLTRSLVARLLAEFQRERPAEYAALLEHQADRRVGGRCYQGPPP